MRLKLENEIKTGRTYGFIYLRLLDFKVEKMADEMKQSLLHFNTHFFKKYRIYKFRENDFILVYNSQKEQPDLKLLETQFKGAYEKFDIDYKVLVDVDCRIDTIDKLRAYCDYIVGSKPDNSYTYASEESKNDFIRQQVVLQPVKL